LASLAQSRDTREQADVLDDATAVKRKLSAAVALSTDDLSALEALLSHRQPVSAGTPLISERQTERSAYAVLSGWAYRYRVFEDGRRQISRLFLPGDFIGLNAALLGLPEQPISALTDMQLAKVDAAQLLECLQMRRSLWLAFLWSDTRDRLISEERVASIGRRSAYERLAHILVELYNRLELTGNASEDRFILPLTQDHLADLLGLTSIHVNRVLRRLKRDNLVSVEGRRIGLLSTERLHCIADYDPRYLMHRTVTGPSGIEPVPPFSGRSKGPADETNRG
jgi:CRP-like cAMP-binding protein